MGSAQTVIRLRLADAGCGALKLQPKWPLSSPVLFLAGIITFVMIQMDFLQALNFK